MRTLHDSLLLASVLALFPAAAMSSPAPAGAATDATSPGRPVPVCADTVGVRVYYRDAYRILEPGYSGNGEQLDSFVERLRSLCSDPDRRLRGIRIVSGASPTGSVRANRSLSDSRGLAVGNYILSRVDIPDSLVSYISVGENWEGLTDMVASSSMPWREEALEILGGSEGAERKRRLRSLHDGAVWRDMRDGMFDELRTADVCVICEHDALPAPEPEPAVEESTPPEVIIEPQPEPQTAEPAADFTETAEDSPAGGFVMAVKTNMLYDVAAVPNLGVEFHLGRGWSIGADVQDAWWSRGSSHRFWRVQGAELSVRKYFGSVASERALSGHHLGLYGQAVNFDFEWGGRGYMGGMPGKSVFERCNYGAGIEYGYSLPVSRRLNIDFGLGIGWFGGKCHEYRPVDTHYVLTNTRNLCWFGPTKAEISLVWLIGNGVVRKGGAK